MLKGMPMSAGRRAIAVLILLAASTVSAAAPARATRIDEFRLVWPGAAQSPPNREHAALRHNHGAAGVGSTHELVFDPRGGKVFWVSGQTYDQVARIELDGRATFFAMPKGSAPHGMAFDARGRLWVTFEGLGEIARLDREGRVVQRIDVRLHARGLKAPLNTHPHGLTVARDGRLWFTGKLSNTVGRVNPDGRVAHFALPTVGAVPIYIRQGPDGAMWCTELIGNRIARITAEGVVTEFQIPTLNSRPIAIVPGPDGRSMWFSQEAGTRVARIDMQGRIAEFPVPMTQDNAILAGLAFDGEGNLWTHQYTNPQAPGPLGDDYLVRFGRALSTAPPGDLSDVAVTFYKARSRGTIMHRIVQGPDDNIWFSELGLDRIGRLRLSR